jgi:GntR family transcriptional regulator
MSNFPFQRLQAELSGLIARTPGGQRLPSEPELAKQMGVSRATLREAMRTFETQGLIRRRQGAGTFVVGKVPVMDSGLEVLESLETMAHRMNLAITVSDLHVERIFADQEHSNALNVQLATRMTRVRRVMQAAGRPAAFLVDTLPETVLRGEPLTGSRTAVSAIGATAEVARALEIQRGDVLLHMSSQLYNASGIVVDYSLTYFIPGYFNFHVVRRVGNSS